MKSPVQVARRNCFAPGHALTLSNVAEGAEGLVISDLARAVAAKPKRAGGQPCGGLPRRSAHGSSWRARWNSSRPICP